jgi:hypothetical protein
VRAAQRRVDDSDVAAIRQDFEQQFTAMPNEDLRAWVARTLAYRELGVVLLLSMPFDQAAVLIVVLQL